MGIVGGVFGLQDPHAGTGSHPSFIKERSLFLVNARSGIALLVKQLSPPQVWVPSYLCHSMLSGTGTGKTSVRFYEVDYNLQVTSIDWLNDVSPGDMAIFIDYFGWPCDEACSAGVRNQRAWVLEDACQALLSRDVGLYSDFILFSPRKFLGIPDGGILASNTELVSFDRTELPGPPMEWWLKALSASILRREFDLYGGSRRWFDLYREVEAENTAVPRSMSELSRALLMHAFDYEEIARRRKENYLALESELKSSALFPELPSGVVPLGFPIRIRNRDEVRQRLYEHEIYPPVHWPIGDVVPEAFRKSHALAADIMTIPCDQRYDAAEMHRVADLVRQELIE